LTEGSKTYQFIEQFKEYFSKFGQVLECQIMKDRETSKPRGFGFISFDTEDAVENVIAKVKEHKLLDKWVECKKATQRTSPPKPSSSVQPRHKALSVSHLFKISAKSLFLWESKRDESATLFSKWAKLQWIFALSSRRISI
jgi:RNA recognition motif-containing protein